MEDHCRQDEGDRQHRRAQEQHQCELRPGCLRLRRLNTGLRRIAGRIIPRQKQACCADTESDGYARQQPRPAPTRDAYDGHGSGRNEDQGGRIGEADDGHRLSTIGREKPDYRRHCRVHHQALTGQPKQEEADGKEENRCGREGNHRASDAEQQAGAEREAAQAHPVDLLAEIGQRQGRRESRNGKHCSQTAVTERVVAAERLRKQREEECLSGARQDHQDDRVTEQPGVLACKGKIGSEHWQRQT